MKKLLAVGAATLFAASAQAQQVFPSEYKGALKLKGCYRIEARGDSYSDPYLGGENMVAPRYGAMVYLGCRGTKEMMMSYSIKTPLQNPAPGDVDGSYGTILESDQFTNGDGFPAGVSVETIPAFNVPYRLIVSGFCCRYR